MSTKAVHADVLGWCEDVKGTFLENLETLTNMDSGSHDYEELNIKSEYIKTLYENCGAKVEIIGAKAPREGTYNIVATWKGTGKAKIMYMAHYDTVWPKGEAKKRPFYIKDNRAYGPGVADRQSSIAGFPVFMDILLNKMNCRDFDTITILMNPDEEIGSFGSRDLIMDLAAKHDVVLSADGACPNGDILYSAARGMAFFDIHIKGIEAHSGVNPEEGRNAGCEMAHQFMKMLDLGDKSKGTDVNWTMGSFGTKTNVIPGIAHAHANVRVTYKEEFARVEADILRHIEDKLYPESEITFVPTYAYPAFEPNPASDALAKKMIALFDTELGLPLRAVLNPGGCDTGYSSQTAPVALDGFCLGGSLSHTVDEFLNLEHFVPRLYLWLRVAEETMRGNMVSLGKAKA